MYRARSFPQVAMETQLSKVMKKLFLSFTSRKGQERQQRIGVCTESVHTCESVEESSRNSKALCRVYRHQAYDETYLNWANNVQIFSLGPIVALYKVSMVMK